MALLEIKKDPSPRELRWFGVILGAFLALLGALAWARWGARGTALTLWIAAAVILGVYYLVPPSRRLLYRAWACLFSPVGWVMSCLLLGVVYYLVVTPIGLGMRVLGRDPMRRRFEPARDSYWVKRAQSRPRSSYFNQF